LVQWTKSELSTGCSAGTGWAGSRTLRTWEPPQPRDVPGVATSASNSGATVTAVPFCIQIPDSVLDDLAQRLVRTRYLAGPQDWDRGTNPAYLKALCGTWQSGYDWRRQERALNDFHHFRAEIGGTGLHFLHHRGQGPDPIPLLLIHGWPDSFARFLKIIPYLTQLQDGVSFDVVVPSSPGFGFSDPPQKNMAFDFHTLLHSLMVDELGYRRFAVHGGDWGSTVTEHMARSHGASLIGIHLTDVPFFHMFQKPADPSAAEERYLKKMEAFPQKGGAYALIQSTKPASLAAGLNDSPAGLAAWLVEKFRDWSDCGGDVETRFSRDELLTHIMIYWVTQTIGSSFQPYYDMGNAGALRWISEMAKGWLGSSDVPAGFALFPKDLVPPPHEWAERFFNVRRWTEMPRGGHFGAWEEPQLLAQELRAMFGPLWQKREHAVAGAA
jgi:pimeloyl-ACP methyl ester carboxylesterase